MLASRVSLARTLCAALLLLSSGTAALARKPATRKATVKAPVAAPPARVDSTPHPNLFELRSGTLSVTFTRKGKDGLPHVEYADAAGPLSFAGPDVQVQPTDVGELVTVIIRRTIDSGSSTFTLVVPLVNLTAPNEVVTVNVLSVTVVRRFSPVPVFNHGQMETAMPAMLNGSARLVTF